MNTDQYNDELTKLMTYVSQDRYEEIVRLLLTPDGRGKLEKLRFINRLLYNYGVSPHDSDISCHNEYKRPGEEVMNPFSELYEGRTREAAKGTRDYMISIFEKLIRKRR